MILCTGDETGLLKLSRERDTVVHGTQGRGAGIVALCGGDPPQASDPETACNVAVLRRNGIFERYIVCRSSLNVELEHSTTTALIDPRGLLRFDENHYLLFDAQGSVLFECQGNVTASMSVRGPLSTVSVCEGGFATAGRENDVQLFDAHSQQVAWAAQNVPQDKLK
jgi:hypothetical protein